MPVAEGKTCMCLNRQSWWVLVMASGEWRLVAATTQLMSTHSNQHEPAEKRGKSARSEAQTCMFFEAFSQGSLSIHWRFGMTGQPLVAELTKKRHKQTGHHQVRLPRVSMASLAQNGCIAAQLSAGGVFGSRTRLYVQPNCCCGW